MVICLVLSKKKKGIYMFKNKKAGTNGTQGEVGRRRHEDGYWPRPARKEWVYICLKQKVYICLKQKGEIKGTQGEVE